MAGAAMQMAACLNGIASLPGAKCRIRPSSRCPNPSSRPFTAAAQPTTRARNAPAPTNSRQSARLPVAARALGSGCSAGGQPTLQQLAGGVARRVLAAGLAAALALEQPGGPALAADTAAVGKCLLGNCPKELATCLADPSCVQNLLCLQTCNGLGPEEESSCQVKCGDKYENEVVQSFNKCALSINNCVPKRIQSAADWPVPPDDALDANFDLSKLTGRWYITAGLNPLFDTFPCQEHFFGVPKPGKLYGRINWRIPKGPKDDFLERTAIQTFDQQSNPAVLFNHGNEYLSYTDDWYVLASRPNEYVLIYYKGNNDAWDGYGGATVYTRKPQLPRQYIPEMRAALKKIGRKWEDFILTDNSCRARAAPTSAADDVARTFEAGVNTPERAAGEGVLEKDLKFAGSKFASIEQFLLPGGSGGGDQQTNKTAAQGEMEDADRYLQQIEKRYAAKRL